MQRYLTPEEQRRILAAALRENTDLAQRDHHIMGALLYSGLRITEFSLIQRQDAEAALIGGYLFIPRENRKGAERADGKRTRITDHSVLVTQPLRHHLTALLDLCENPDRTAPLVLGRDGGSPMTARNFQQRVRHWAREAGITLPVSPHWFRHTRAMNLLRASQSKDPMGVIQHALGHASRNSTAIYAGPSREEIEAELHRADGRTGRRPSKAAMRREYTHRATDL